MKFSIPSSVNSNYFYTAVFTGFLLPVVTHDVIAAYGGSTVSQPYILTIPLFLLVMFHILAVSLSYLDITGVTTVELFYPVFIPPLVLLLGASGIIELFIGNTVSALLVLLTGLTVTVRYRNEKQQVTLEDSAPEYSSYQQRVLDAILPANITGVFVLLLLYFKVIPLEFSLVFVVIHTLSTSLYPYAIFSDAMMSTEDREATTTRVATIIGIVNFFTLGVIGWILTPVYYSTKN